MQQLAFAGPGKPSTGSCSSASDPIGLRGHLEADALLGPQLPAG